jgi:DNA mismatch repair protein MutS
MGSRLLRAWLTHRCGTARLGRRHDALAWAAAHPIEREQCQAVLRGIPDLGRLAGKVGARSAGPRDLHGLRLGLRGVLDLGGILARCEPPELLKEAVTGLSAAADALLTIDAALDDDPPAAFDEGGVIRRPGPRSTRGLARARGFLLALERSERERTASAREGGAQPRVRLLHRKSRLERGRGAAQRRQTLVGAERYVTEELKEHESRLGARDRLVELERQAYAALESLANWHSAGRGRRRRPWTLPRAGRVASEGSVPGLRGGWRSGARGGRHPVVSTRWAGRSAPTTATRARLLTGPNMPEVHVPAGRAYR